MAKFKRIDTGEIVNIVSWGANGTFTNYYDSQGKFQHTDLNRYNYFEEIIESSQSGIDWEQRRYEIAKDMLCAIYMDEGNENAAQTQALSLSIKVWRVMQGKLSDTLTY